MTSTASAAALAAPTRKWSVDGFARFWAKPGNIEIINEVVWPEIVGYWPRCKNPLQGREAYVEGIANFLWHVPQFSAQVTDYAINGEVVFVRWEAVGRPPVGPERITGVDRLLLRDDYVLENRIHSDHPVFEYLARTEIVGGSLG